MDNSIVFNNVTKSYFIQEDKTFKELLPNLLLGKAWAKRHTVFKNLSFNIELGESVGIMGKNGSGKSTLLKLIAGVTFPDSGQVHISGKVAPLIELGAGFHHELSGYENIFLNGAILGMHKLEIEKKLDEIIAFSELGEFIHTPVKRYSSGMYMRLGFSVAIYTDTPILLVDEVLAVGDISFQKKCLTKLEQIKKEKNRTIIFVSHSEDAIKDFCDRGIVLSQGQKVFDGNVNEAIKKYHAEMLKDATLSI